MFLAPLMPIISLAATAAGAGVTALGAMQQGAAQSAMYNYQASVAQINAKIQKQNAEYAVNQGETQAAISGMQSRFRIGQIIAGQGASGIAVGQGTSGDVIAGEHQIATMNEAMIRNNAARAAWGYEVGAAQDVAQAGAYSSASKTSMTAGEIGAAGSLLGGIGSVSSKWIAYGASGVPGFGTAAPNPVNLGGAPLSLNPADYS